MTDCLPGSVVFDAYCGTTSSLKAALKVGHSFYGFERDNRKFKKMSDLVNKYKEKGEI